MGSRIPSGSAPERVLAQLRRGPATVEQLAQRLAVTPNAVRANLSALVRAGLAERTGVRRRPARGQPPTMFAVTELGDRHFSSAYAPALTALVGALADRLSPADLRNAFADAGASLGRDVGGSQREPAQIAVSILEDLGAIVTSARSADGTTIEGMACPLASAVRNCHETCELVRSMLATASQAPVRTDCDHGSAPRCRFHVSG